MMVLHGWTCVTMTTQGNWQVPKVLNDFSAMEASLEYFVAQKSSLSLYSKTPRVPRNLVEKAITKSPIPEAWLLAKTMGQSLTSCPCDALTCVPRIKAWPLRQPLSSPSSTYQRPMNHTVSQCYALRVLDNYPCSVTYQEHIPRDDPRVKPNSGRTKSYPAVKN